MFWKRRTYLDAAAGASGNPSSPHEEGRRAKGILDAARTVIARLVEVQSDDVIFTSGATESNALAILGHVRALRAAGRSDVHMLYLPSAHASIVENAMLLATEGVLVEELPIKDYRVNIEALSKMMRKETALISMDAVCGETGVVWNTREVAEILRKFRTGALENGHMLHVDASQAPLTEKISRAHFGADLLTFDASKVGDVRGVGALIAHRTIPLVPLYTGGGQERGLRPGSENPLAVRDFARALSVVVRGREVFRAVAESKRTRLVEFIKKTIPNVYIQEGRSQAPHILNISLPGRDTDYLVALLDEAGFAVATRSACETDSEEGSRAVLALTGDSARARATLRISWGPGVRQWELTRFAQALARSVAFIDSSS
ncbi:MAG: cysteine desulfurase family protein [Minisyncoccota bacterium]